MLTDNAFQAVLVHASNVWGGIDGFERHEEGILLAKSKEACIKNAERLEKRQQLELSAKGQQLLSNEAKLYRAVAARSDGGLARRAELSAAFSAVGLRLCADQLCSDYITLAQGRPDAIANIMLDKQWLSDNTDIDDRTLRVGQTRADLFQASKLVCSVPYCHCCHLQAVRQVARQRKKYIQGTNAAAVDWEAERIAARETARSSAMRAWCQLHPIDHPMLPMPSVSLMQLVPPELQHRK